MWKILIVEDDLDVAELIAQSFPSKEYTFKFSTSAKTAKKVVDEFVPDVIILDVLIHDGSGHDVLRYLQSSKSKAIVFTISGSDAVVGADLYDLKAHAFFRKPFEPNDLIAAVRRFLPEIPTSSHARPLLTQRETEVLKLLYEGLSSGEIASKLSISSRTVEQHRDNLRKKIGAKNTAELIRKALPFVS
jgi:DNA-binding NarL/FixJ family response regulator